MGGGAAQWPGARCKLPVSQLSGEGASRHSLTRRSPTVKRRAASTALRRHSSTPSCLFGARTCATKGCTTVVTRTLNTRTASRGVTQTPASPALPPADRQLPYCCVLCLYCSYPRSNYLYSSNLVCAKLCDGLSLRSRCAPAMLHSCSECLRTDQQQLAGQHALQHPAQTTANVHHKARGNTST